MKYQVVLISSTLEEQKRGAEGVSAAMHKAARTEGPAKGKKFQEVASILDQAWSRMTFDAIEEAKSLVDEAKDKLMTIRALARQELDRWSGDVADKALRELSAMGIMVESPKPALRTLTIELVGDPIVTAHAVRQVVKAVAEIARDGINPIASQHTSINPCDSESAFLLEDIKIPRVVGS